MHTAAGTGLLYAPRVRQCSLRLGLYGPGEYGPGPQLKVEAKISKQHVV